MKDHKCCIVGANPCPLASSKYFKNLLMTARETYKGALKLLCKSDSRIIEAAGPFDEHAGDIRLTSTDVHSKTLLLRATGKKQSTFPTSEQIETVHRRFIFCLTEKSESLNYYEQELLFWSAIQCKAIGALSAVLKSGSVSKCLMASALREAMDDNHVEIVRLLFENGASPIDDMVSAEQRGPLMYLCFDDEDVLSAEICCPCEKSKGFAEITNLLLHHGAQILPNEVSETENVVGELGEWVDEDDDTLQNPLDYLSQIAFKSPDAAQLLIEAASPLALSLSMHNLQGLENPWVDDSAPLRSTLADACWVAFGEDGPSRKAKVARILSACVFPLLRAGAILDQDIFFGSELSLLVQFCTDYSMAPKAAADIWPHLVLELLADIRGTLSPRPLKCARLLKSLRKIGKEEPEMVDRFRKTAVLCYPRTLLRLARSSILRNLPVGAKARSDAIEKLDLPNILEAFLKFQDHDILLNLLQSH